MHVRRLTSFLASGVLGCSLLAGCGGEKAGATGAQADDGLPKPAAASGSVTGMPNPGIADPRPAPAAARRPDIVEYPDPVDGSDVAPADPGASPVPVEGPPVMLPAPPMPEDPNAPPPPPEQAESRVQDGNPR